MIHYVSEIRIRASVIGTQNKPTAAMRLGVSPDTFEFFRRQYGIKMAEEVAHPFKKKGIKS